MTIAPMVALILLGLIAAWFDVRQGRVPNALTYPAMVGGLVYWAAAGWLALQSWQPLGDSAVGLLAGLVPALALVLMGGLGGGDMKLMGAVGAWLASWTAVLDAAVYALLVAVLLAFFVMFRRGIVKQTLARVIGAAVMASARVKPDLPDARDPETVTVPFAVGIAVGAALAGAEHLLGWQPPWSVW